MMNRSHGNDRSFVRQARAVAIQDVERYYRYWVALVAEKRAELAQRQAADEAEDDLLEAPQVVQLRRAKLPPAVREELTAALRLRQQQAQEQAESTARQGGQATPDPDSIYAALLTQIGEELEGRRHPLGWALVWYEGTHHEFNRSEAMRTTDDDYLAISDKGPLPSRMQMVVVGGGGLLGLVLMAALFYWLFLYQPAATTASGPLQVAVGQRSVTAWDVTMGSIASVSGAVKAQLGYPLRLCVSQAQQRVATPGATLVLTGTESVRSYQLSAPASATADVLVQDCTSTPPRTVAAASLVQTRTRQMLDASLVTGAAVWGPDTDPASIPSDRMVVDLTISDPDGGSGTLVLANGTRFAATMSNPVEKGVVVRYLVPFSPAPQRVGYERVQVGSLPAVLPLDLPAPTSRAALLRQVVQVVDAKAMLISRDGRPTLDISFVVSLASDAAPLTLIPSDVVFTQSAGSIAESAIWTPPALKPGTETTFQVSLPFNLSYPTLDVELAGWRARLNLKETP